MKTFLLILCAGLAFIPARAADSVKLSEVLRDVNVCSRFEGEISCEVVQRNSGRVSARVTIPGLSAAVFTEDSEISGSIGGLSLGGSLGDARTFGQNRAVFQIVEEYEVETRDGDFITRFRRIGTVTFSRAHDVLTMNASFSKLPESIVAGSGSWDEQTGLGQTQLSLAAGGLSYSKNVNFKARVTTQRNRDPDADPLHTVTIVGQADFTRPTVTIASPRNRVTTTNDTITFRGTARDNFAVAEVQYRVGGDDWFTGELTYDRVTQWSAVVPVAPGTNIVQVRSLDFEGLESKPVARTVLRPVVP